MALAWMKESITVQLERTFDTTDNSTLFTCESPWCEYLVKIPEENQLAQTQERHIYNVFSQQSPYPSCLLQARELNALHGDRILNSSTSEPVDITEGTMLIERASDVDLFHVLQCTGAFTEHMARTLFRQIVQGVQELHSGGIAHLDLKLEQIVFTPNKCALKIIDLAYAAECGLKGMHHLMARRGTQSWMSHEMLNLNMYRGERVNLFAQDVWQLGMMLFCLLFKFPPFQVAISTGPERCRWYQRWLQPGQEDFWQLVTKSSAAQPATKWRTGGFQPSSEFKNLMYNMLHPNVERRLTLQEVMEHEWYVDTDHNNISTPTQNNNNNNTPSPTNSTISSTSSTADQDIEIQNNEVVSIICTLQQELKERIQQSHRE